MNQSQNVATTTKAAEEIKLQRRSFVIGQRYRDRTPPQRKPLVKLNGRAAG
jgi:hypothetical protein